MNGKPFAARRLWGVLSLFLLPLPQAWAGRELAVASASPGTKHVSIAGKPVEITYGGYLKLKGYLSWPDDDSLYSAVGTGTYEDGVAEARLKSTLFFGKSAYFDAQYEMIYAGGETRRKNSELADILPEPFKGFFLTRTRGEDTRFMDLTGTIHEDESSVWYHGMDRLYLALLPDWGSFSIGR